MRGVWLRDTGPKVCKSQKGSRTKINYDVSITLYIVVVKAVYPIYVSVRLYYDIYKFV